MPPAMRSFVAVIAGMVVAVTVVSVFDLLASLMHPLPEGIDVNDMAALQAHAAAAPVSALALVLLGWAAGPFAGGLVASRVAARRRASYAWIIMSLLFAATLANLFAIPHPTWMVAGAVLLIPAAGWLAARLAPPDEAPAAST